MKNKLRTVAKHVRNNIDFDEYQKNSRKICSHLRAFIQKSGYRHVYCYYPLGSEADILPLAEGLLEQDIELAFPKVCGNDMSFIQIRDLKKDFKEGAFHIMEPVSDQSVDWSDACVLVPGLVFDMYGNRIGYGKGYYDRYFSGHTCDVLIGITDSRLILDKLIQEEELKADTGILINENKTEEIKSIPAESHDLKMNIICTEQEITVTK